MGAGKVGMRREGSPIGCAAFATQLKILPGRRDNRQANQPISQRSQECNAPE